MATVLGRLARHDDLVTLAGPDLVIAVRTPIRPHCFVRLDVADVDTVIGLGPRMTHRGHAAHSTSNSITTIAVTTSAMSLLRCTCLLNGLNPTPQRYASADAS